MKTTVKSPKIRMNLSIDPIFYELLKNNAQNSYIPVSTWVQQFLKKSLFQDKTSVKCETQNETKMQNQTN
jgi:hypothetical protein